MLDANGTPVAEFTSVKASQSVVLSSPDVVDGAVYTVTVDGQLAGSVTAGVAAAGGMAGGAAGGGVGGPPNRP